MKIIKVADRSEFGWTTVKEYEEDDLASDSDDESRLFRSEKRADRVVTKARRARSRRERTQPGDRQHTNQSCASQTSRQSRPMPYKFGPCFKITKMLIFFFRFLHKVTDGAVTSRFFFYFCIASECFKD